MTDTEANGPKAKVSLSAPATEDDASLALYPNSLYLIRLQALENTPAAVGECDVALQLGFRSGVGSLTVLRRIQVVLPVTSGAAEDYAVPGKWYEQVLFVHAGDLVNALRWSWNRPQAIQFRLTATRFSVDHASRAPMNKLLTALGAKQVRIRGKTYQPFLGTREVLKQLAMEEKALSASPQPVLTAAPESMPPQGPLVGLVGDGMMGELLATTFPCVRITPETITNIHADAFDLIAIQSRASNIAPPSSPDMNSAQFASDLASALATTSTPIIELASPEPASFRSCLKPLRNCGRDTVVDGAEFELCRLAPLRGETWSPQSIAIPCASDLYQYPEFQELARRLVDSGFTLTISESNFDHVPARTWERFVSPSVKVYGRLSLQENAALFRNCGFVLLPGYSLRSPSDLANLAVAALMSGALPIIVGRELIAPLGDVVQSVWGYRALHDYLTSNGALLVRERHWLSRYRRLVRHMRRSRFIDGLTEAAYGRRILRSKSAQPSAEMICISKRPANLDKIVANLDRQAYGNVAMHLIWNVPSTQESECLDMCKHLRRDNLRVSILPEHHNIGSCLNMGRRQSPADFWFKVDDDDHYGKNYVEDMVSYYTSTGCDSVGKSSAFVLFNSNGEIHLRNHASGQIRRILEPGAYFCGATLSGRKAANLPEFSTTHRNSCDSHWVEILQALGHHVVIADFFNFCINRGDPSQHTWQADEAKLKRASDLVAKTPCLEWFDAD